MVIGDFAVVVIGLFADDEWSRVIQNLVALDEV
jgi:hypothetical protein